MRKLKVTLQLSSPGASDVATRELNTKINGADPIVTNPAVGDTEASFTFVPGPTPNTCECWLVDIDLAGNRSAESEHLVFEANDDFAPPAPGALGVISVSEIEE